MEHVQYVREIHGFELRREARVGVVVGEMDRAFNVCSRQDCQGARGLR